MHWLYVHVELNQMAEMRKFASRPGQVAAGADWNLDRESHDSGGGLVCRQEV